MCGVEFFLISHNWKIYGFKKKSDMLLPKLLPKLKNNGHTKENCILKKKNYPKIKKKNWTMSTVEKNHSLLLNLL